MPSPRLLSLSLESKSRLQIEYANWDGETCLLPVDLDYSVGNSEGTFDTGGFHFSRSARDVDLAGNVLHAQLSTSGGVWWDDQVVVELEFPKAPITSGPPRVRLHRSDPQRLSPWCRNLRLVGKFMLAGQCLQADGSYRDVYVNLDKCLGHNNGAFDRHGRGFSSSAAAVELVGTMMYAVWNHVGGPGGVPGRAAIGLETILHVTDGVPKPLRQDITPEELDLEVLRDDPWGIQERSWIPNATNIRLLSYRRKRFWYLVADFQVPGGTFRESLLALHEVLGPHADQMFGGPWFSSPDIPEPARETRLENGILRASFQGRGAWQERSIDLRGIVTSRDGQLVLHRSGSDCPGCRELFYAGVLYTPWSGHITKLDLPSVKSVRATCVLCRLFNDTIKSYTPRAASHEAWVTTAPGTRESWSHASKREVQLVVRATLGGKHKWQALLRPKPSQAATMMETRYTLLLDVEAAGTEDDDDEKLSAMPRRLATLARNNSNSCWLEPERRWSVIGEWFETCSTKHVGCRDVGDDAPELPSRYLDIGPGTGEDGRQSHVARVITASPGERGSYACLSHCWGGSRHVCTLNRETEGRFSAGIPADLLPPVFVSAIAACRRLGISRIWIDSLCILQDSVEDWQRESPKMGQYYSQCEICIAATSSASSNAGFELHATRPSAVRSSAPAGPRSQRRFSLLMQPADQAQPPPHFVQAQKTDTTVRDFPLLTRGWVLQERWLAPRVLHFGKQEVVFECAETTACECGGAAKDLMEQIGLGAGFAAIRSTTTARHGLLRRRTHLEHLPWDELVPMYSALALTVPTDRLTAVSGMAAVLYAKFAANSGGPKVSGVSYLAGLWRHTLPRDVAWFVGETLLRNKANEQRLEVTGSRNSESRKPRPEQYLAPTWSWASVLDAVRYLEAHDQISEFRVLDTHVSLATDNAFGAVAEGCSLHLQGKILPTAWTLRPVKNGTEREFVLGDLVGTQQLDAEDSPGLVFAPDFDIQSPGIHQVRPMDVLYVFPVLTQQIKYARWIREAAEMFDASRSTSCLVLKAVDGLDPKYGDVFERVGFAEYANFGGGKRNLDSNAYEMRSFFLV
ncbi:heterokaryon incompatibility protein-domain-containing protein [Lasiosphaeria ovina]|uniref:Heterokaryon incompatibility protein-domain-containing protein n=1 Tax=Lasiosphaeria ovina TaxID=92902 RepID=A0AAE0JUK5_9PEZI|nr:heterokaryon incompatibility protein-domain-containing protein [Lasiosphaeria ovina]